MSLKEPVEDYVTRPLRKAGVAAGNAEVLSLWARQGAPMARARTVAETISDSKRELRDATGALSKVNWVVCR